MRISEEVYRKMPSSLRALFKKLPNPDSEEVVELFPETGSGRGYKPRSKNRTVKQFDPAAGWNQHSMDPNNANAPDDYGDRGSAARFFYCAKASRRERGEGNNHPTVKPLVLIEYLCRLTKTPAGGIVFDPFIGSGTTAMGALKTGRHYFGCDINSEYVKIAGKRLSEVQSGLEFP